MRGITRLMLKKAECDQHLVACLGQRRHSDIRNLVRKAAHNETTSNSKLRDFLKLQVDEFLQDKDNYLHNADRNMPDRSQQIYLNIPASQSDSSLLYDHYKKNINETYNETYTTGQERRGMNDSMNDGMEYSNSNEPKTFLSDAMNVDDWPQRSGSNAGNNNRHLALIGNLEPSRNAIEMSRRQLQDATIGNSKFQKFENDQIRRSSSASHAFSHNRSPQNIRRVWSHPV